MNPDELANPNSPSTSTTTGGRRIRVRSLKRSSISLEASLPSIPSDGTDWVSPFTLPPLPALKKNRSQIDPFPEDRIHNRSGSSAYYAAAWGSPYATPSPNQSSAIRLNRNKSLDLESSPLVSKKSSLEPSSSNHSRRQSLPTHEPTDRTDSASISSADRDSKHQRRNWLSESEDSASELDQEIGNTPTTKNQKQSSLANIIRSHHVQGSVATITPETFNGTSSPGKSLKKSSLSRNMADTHTSSPSPALDDLSAKEKPLPSLPEDLSTSDAPSAAHSRPSLSLPTPSFQRVKKKVPWRGKHCMIAMPITDREQAGLPPVLTPQEKEEIMQGWIDRGYPLYGFTVGDWTPSAHQSGGSSRTTFPDSQEMEHERGTKATNIHIHNPDEWQAWVDYLKEEKLRALGVTPSTSEAAPSTVSPFSSTMSRVSSAYPSMAPSPPILPPSSASGQPRMTHSPFSPSLANISVPGFTVASQRGTPQLGTGPRPMHGYTQSIAIPGMGQRVTSPFEYPISQPAAFGSGLRTPNDQFPGRRPFSPGHIQNLQSMGHILSPVGMNSFPPEYARNLHSNPQVAHIQQQQEAIARHQLEIQAQIARANHQKHMSLFPPRAMSSERLPLTPKTVSPEREPPVIMQPTPRSHRHNLSAALEKGVIDSVAASSKGLDNIVGKHEHGMNKMEEVQDEIEEGEIQENEQEREELPVLARPETLADKDEIETNPSIAGTPLLLDDKNPFTNFKPLVPSTQSTFNPGFGHSAQPSLTKLNVQAREFNPLGLFSGAAFNMGENVFMPKLLLNEKAVQARPSLKSHQRNMSSLNVDAPVFTPAFIANPPQAAGDAEIISVTNNDITTPAKASVGSAVASLDNTPAFSHVGDKTPAHSDFNPRSSTFSFTSANFNVDAPEFKPSSSLSDIMFTPEKIVDVKDSIFGDAVLNLSSTLQKTDTNKNRTVARSFSREGSPEDEDTAFDEDGRSKAPSERTKRTKTFAPDIDIEFLIAAHAPFTSLAEDKKHVATTEEIEEAEQHLETMKETDSPTETAPERAAVLHSTEEREDIEPAEEKSATSFVRLGEPKSIQVQENTALTLEKKEEEAEPQFSASTPESALHETSPAHVEETKDAKIKEEDAIVYQDKTEQNTATSEVLVEPSIAEIHNQSIIAAASPADAVKIDTNTAGHVSTEERSTTVAVSADTDFPKSALSALVTPFKFQPAADAFVPAAQSEPAAEKIAEDVADTKGAGLMASKFASSPVLESRTPEKSDEQPSSPLLLFGETRHFPSEPVSKSVPESAQQATAFNEADGYTDDDFDAQADELDRISNLEDHKNENSRPISVASRVSDMSIEEINAVMKQFEENPDLGIIREATPVKQTPLVDMRFRQQNFRSDAPSPSPGRLDRPFNAAQNRAYDGLGFEVEGIHRLDFGSGEVSDWNTALSPGQQDKLEARAHFFDDHVNDLVDNILESRLAPLERALASIQHAVQNVNVKARGRRSLSTDKNDSDADDEDEYDAYEGYAHYRSLSPKKRDRRQEQIKAAVMEAVTVAQATAPAPAVDMTVIQGALQEIRDLSTKPIVSLPPPVIDHDPIHTALGELRALMAQESKTSASDTKELRSMLQELKNSREQPDHQAQPDVTTMHATLQELRQLLVEKADAPPLDLTSLHEHIADMKQRDSSRTLEEQSDNLKAILEDVIATHPRLRGSRVEQEHDGSEKLKMQITGLEAMLKVAEKRADGEAALRREAEDENDTLRTHLKEAQDHASSHKEASEEAQKSLEAVLLEKQQYRELSNESRELQHRNEILEKKAEALEKTLDEYRVYKEEMRTELDAARARNSGLARSLDDIREQARSQLDSRDLLRDQLNRLQQRMAKVVEDVRHDEAEWRKREHDIMGKNQLLQSALEHETHRRARLELDADRLQKEHRESLHFKSLQDTTQNEVSRLLKIMAGVEADNKTHQDAAYRAQSELTYIKEKQEEMIASHTTRLQDDLDASKITLRNLQGDSDGRIARLQGQIDAAAIEFQEQKIKHDQNTEKMFENHNQAIRNVNTQHALELDAALREAKEKHMAELDQRLAAHEEKLVDLKHQHLRDLKNANEDRDRLEQNYVEKLALSNDKIKHLEAKLVDVEDRYEVTKTAARAVVEAATAKGANLPTPANSVVASPPHRASVSSASMPITRGTDLPEKISPQALRETIIVLQDQLQNREQNIDRLESELASVDKDAPTKIKERDTEIAMLRELLDVRIDDLQELISTLGKPNYDRAAIKDAAIRIKTQIKMEQQLKERAMTGGSLVNSLPNTLTSGLANLAQSPRAMVAAAAWGNWRKVKDSGVNAMSEFANSVSAQTPSRVSSSPSSLLAGIMTPPSTNFKSSDGVSQPSTARPLAAAAAARRTGSTSSNAGARPLRAFNNQPRTLAGARPTTRRGTNESRPGSSGSVIRMSESSSMGAEPPSTPLARKAESDFGDDVDEDASPLDGKDKSFGTEDLEELVRSEQTAMRSTSPELRRSITGSDEEEEERVVVIEES